MKKILFEIATPEQVLLRDEIDEVTVPTMLGDVTVLPSHTPLVSVIKPGELRVKKGAQESFIVIHGGFIQVQPGSKVNILADAAEKVEELEEKAIEDAKKRAEAAIAQKRGAVEIADAQAALARALLQLKVVRRRKSRRM